MKPWDEAEIEWAPPSFGAWAFVRGVLRVTAIIFWTLFWSIVTVFCVWSVWLFNDPI